ncbi:MAG: peptide deformylase [Candidatus Saccharimonadales bacterium]
MATKDDIITLPDKALRQKSRRVGIITPEIHRVIENMKEATLDWEATRQHEVGVALAAVQINKLLKIVVIRGNFDDKQDHTFQVFINPQITKLEGEIEDDFEGCLSVTDIYGKVPRRSKVRLRALDENGREIRVKAEGFLARVLQHEVDHTDGILFTDHIKDSPEAFFELTDEGKLKRLDYEKVRASGIFRD